MKDTNSTGLKKETAAALSYAIGPLTGILMLLLEKDSFVRFHAMQSIVVFGVLIVLQWVLSATVILSVLVPLTTIVGFVLWLVLMYKASQGERFSVPVLGKYAEKFLH